MTATRAAGYVRVSTAGQAEEGFSLDAQRRAIRAYCEAHGWPQPAIYADEGLSAHTDDVSKRPAFAAMLTDAEAGRFDVLIVHRLDRFARNVITALETLHRLEKAGVGFMSITESIDMTTPIGRVLLTLLAAFAQYYSDNLSAETKKGKAERKRQGLYNGVLPYGTRAASGGVPVLDTQPWSCHLATHAELSHGAGLRQAFLLAAEGMSDREIARAMNAAGYRTTGNRGQNRFQKDSVRVILTNRFYVGELPDGDDGWLPGRHGELIDLALFERVQRMRQRYAGRTAHKVRRHRTWALAGIACCAECGAPLRMHGRRRVWCADRSQGLGCQQKSVSADVLEDQLGDVLRHIVPTPDALALLRDAPPAPVPFDGPTRASLDRKLSRLRELYLEGDITKADYQARRRALEAERAALPDRVPPALPDDLAGELAVIAQTWAGMDASARQRVACQLFERVWVMDQQVLCALPRPELRPAFGLLIPTSRKRRASILRCGHPTPAECVWVDGLRPYRADHRGHAHALTPSQEAAICQRGESTRALALEYGVSRQAISDIRKRGGVA